MEKSPAGEGAEGKHRDGGAMGEEAEEQSKRKDLLLKRMHISVAKIAEQESVRNGITVEPQLLSTITQLTYDFAENLAKDLEAFAHHASRKSVTVEDVLLTTRRNADIASQLKAFVEELAKREGPPQPRKKKKAAAPSAYDDY